MHTSRPHHRKTRAIIIAVGTGAVIGLIAVLTGVFTDSPASETDGYLPKDVPSTPAASPLASAPPETALRSDAVTLDLTPDSPVGPDTSVTGTANSPNGIVYYRISDYRHGQIAGGEVTVTAGSVQPFQFKPAFGRVYTPGDPATLDVYVLNADGSEAVTRIPITLQ